MMKNHKNQTPLSKQETKILQLYGKCLTDREIGHALGIKPTSVQTYKRRILLKIGVASMLGAFISGLKTGIVKLSKCKAV